MRFFLYLLLLAFLPIAKSQNFDSLCRQQLNVLAELNQKHIQFPVLNEKTKTEITDLFLKLADERNMIALSPDKKALEQILIKDTSSKAFCSFIEKSHAIFSQRLQQVDSIINGIEKKQIQFPAKDSVTFFSNPNNRYYRENLSELSNRINMLIKYDCIQFLLSNKKDSVDVLKLSAAELNRKTEEAKKNAIKQNRRFLSDFVSTNKLSHHLANCLANAIANRCDPHSNFYTAEQLQDFNQSMSNSELSFGFNVEENDEGLVCIKDLVPGGPAWKSNSLNEEDVIISFHLQGEPEFIIEPWDIQHFYQVFYKSAAKSVELKIRKPDYKIVKVKLTKEKIQSQENVINSYLVNYNGHKTGFIPIPSFYLDDEEDSRQGCANDLAKEIVKLKQDSIEGLILDLRYNGGGSMREAMGLAGIFIDEGPVAIYKPKQGKPILLKDLNRGSIWDGPLIILINTGSASASEFVTATLQDYNRAVIVGSRSFGKGTAQSVYTVKGENANFSNKTEGAAQTGYLKITISKFYRITKISHQGKGIQPDIYVPGIIEKVAETESDFPFYLACDSVSKNIVYAQLPALPKGELAKLSADRVKNKKQFQIIQLIGDSLQKARLQNDKIELSIKGIKKYKQKQKELGQRIEEVFIDDEKNITISVNTLNEKVYNLNDYEKKNLDNSLDVLKKDLILHEGIYVLTDLINLIKK